MAILRENNNSLSSITLLPSGVGGKIIQSFSTQIAFLNGTTGKKYVKTL